MTETINPKLRLGPRNFRPKQNKFFGLDIILWDHITCPQNVNKIHPTFSINAYWFTHS